LRVSHAPPVASQCDMTEGVDPGMRDQADHVEPRERGFASWRLT